MVDLLRLFYNIFRTKRWQFEIHTNRGKSEAVIWVTSRWRRAAEIEAMGAWIRWASSTNQYKSLEAGSAVVITDVVLVKWKYWDMFV